MSRQGLLQRLRESDETRVELSPLIDVVFILLIFFIVSTVFVREAGVDVEKPNALSAELLDRRVLIVAVTAGNDVYFGGTNVGVDGVRATLEPLLRQRQQSVVVQADAAVRTEILVKVIDQANLAGASSVHIATEQTR
ncbi:MAG: biopolymer transporter ExbD [Gammaproteobacteria bacterium]|nr:biopolymer transporter ExbD [Gammaproteobacteria bacterium]|tara:strand:- start:11351 stop:11764 length:414 start_codon:yes stop_codon:yes gene_type:complete